MKGIQKKKSASAIHKRLFSAALAAVMTAALLPGTAFQAERAEAADVTLSNPRFEKDASMETGEKVTWDCVWFGSYPQAEVVPSGTYTAVDESILQEGDIIVSDAVYNALQSAEGWDDKNEITLGGERYRRMKKEDAGEIHTYSSKETYQWSDSSSYHYFKYEPIKWRVLHTDGAKAFLLSDLVLDYQKYDEHYSHLSENGEYERAVWENSTIRSWLNGYSADSNWQLEDYSDNNFMDYAFSDTEQAAIFESELDNTSLTSWLDGGNDTVDKIFLLSESEVSHSDEAVSYGFARTGMHVDEARCCKSSIYAKAMGIFSSTSAYFANGEIGYGEWWLRSPGSSIPAAHIWGLGYVLDYTDDLVPERLGIRMALNLDLSATELYSYAGTAESARTVESEVSPGGDDQEYKEYGDYLYRIYEDGTVEISRYNGDEETLVVPLEIAGGNEIVIGDDAFAYCENLAKVTIPSGVTYIGYVAFQGCSNLKEMFISETVKYVENNTFKTGASIKLYFYGSCPFDDYDNRVIVGEGSTIYVLEKNWDSFAEVRAENSYINWVKWNGSLADGGETSKPEAPSTSTPPQNTSTPNGSTTLSIGETVQDAGTGASYKVLSQGAVQYVKPLNTSSTSITVPKEVVLEGVTYKVTTAAASAFKGNKKLTSVTLGNNVQKIAASAFSGCTKLKSVTIGTGVTEIGAKAFSKCTALTKITIPAKVSKIGKQAFGSCKKLKTITIKSKKLTAKSVAAKAFKGVPASATVKVPKAKRAAYKKILRAKGLSAKVKIK